MLLIVRAAKWQCTKVNNELHTEDHSSTSVLSNVHADETRGVDRKANNQQHYTSPMVRKGNKCCIAASALVKNNKTDMENLPHVTQSAMATSAGASSAHQFFQM